MPPAPNSQEPLTNEKPVPNGRRRRVPKSGLGFSLLRLFGIALQGIGVLIAIASCIGFFILLVRIAPGLTDAMQHLESQMAGFTFIIMLAWLFAPLVLAFLGAISFGLGFVFYRVSTSLVSDAPVIANP
jgi:cytochrome b561